MISKPRVKICNLDLFTEVIGALRESCPQHYFAMLLYVVFLQRP